MKAGEALESVCILEDVRQDLSSFGRGAEAYWIRWGGTAHKPLLFGLVGHVFLTKVKSRQNLSQVVSQ